MKPRNPAEKSNEIVMWYNAKQFSVFKMCFFKSLETKFPNNKFTKSLKGSLVGPVKRLRENCYKVKG